MRVKICGITNRQEAKMAISSGADAIGFLIGLNYQVADSIEPVTAEDIISNLPPFISSVLVTHKTNIDWVIETCERINCTTVQLHGDFPLEDIPILRQKIPYLKIVKTVHVTDESAVGQAISTSRWADAVQLDTRTKNLIGGTGITHDWSISSRIVREVDKPVILSGGLNPQNILNAIDTVRPYGVDVNSGVENQDGSKSSDKVRSFIIQAKGERDKIVSG
jgi:phosphoribosylanthranilate isomerase